MKVTIDIDVKAARSALYISSGSPEQTRVATEGTDEEVINLASSIKLAADQILAYNRQEFGGDSKCPNQESGIINIFLNSCQILLDSITGFSEQIKATAEYFDAMDHELQQALESSFGISGYDITSGGDK